MCCTALPEPMTSARALVGEVKGAGDGPRPLDVYDDVIVASTDVDLA